MFFPNVLHATFIRRGTRNNQEKRNIYMIAPKKKNSTSPCEFALVSESCDTCASLGKHMQGKIYMIVPKQQSHTHERVMSYT